MSEEQLKSRCPDAQFECVVKLADYELEFPRASKKRGCGVASITERPGSDVYGVLFNLSDEDFVKLDRAEGVAVGAYTREQVEVEALDTVRHLAQTYIAVRADSPPLPSREYLDILILGAIEHGLPPEYVEGLKRIPVLGDV